MRRLVCKVYATAERNVIRPTKSQSSACTFEMAGLDCSQCPLSTRLSCYLRMKRQLSCNSLGPRGEQADSLLSCPPRNTPQIFSYSLGDSGPLTAPRVIKHEELRLHSRSRLRPSCHAPRMIFQIFVCLRRQRAAEPR